MTDPGVPFADRAAAGRAVGARLELVLGPLVRRSAGRSAQLPPVVLGIPRGGVPVAAEVARILRAPLDVLVAHKVGAPGEPELAVGAVATDGTARMEPWAREAGIADETTFARAAAAELGRARAREVDLRDGRAPIELAGRTAIVIDDGMATGSTMHVAVLAARAAGASRVVVAVPVASSEAVSALERVADDVVAVVVPRHFRSVGEWYVRFDQLADDVVAEILTSAADGSSGGSGSGGGTNTGAGANSHSGTGATVR
jgi:putative phosphoribosyl transferase